MDVGPARGGKAATWCRVLSCCGSWRHVNLCDLTTLLCHSCSAALRRDQMSASALEHGALPTLPPPR